MSNYHEAGGNLHDKIIPFSTPGYLLIERKGKKRYIFHQQKIGFVIDDKNRMIREEVMLSFHFSFFLSLFVDTCEMLTKVMRDSLISRRYYTYT